jgi:hypothetical protein
MRVTFEGVAQEWLELQGQSLSPENLSILGVRLNSGPLRLLEFPTDRIDHHRRSPRRASQDRSAGTA